MIDRRRFLAGAGALPLAAAFGASALGKAFAAESGAPAGAGWRSFEISTTVDLAAVEGPAQVWLPLAGSDDAYQIASAPRWSGADGAARIVADPASGARMLHARVGEGDNRTLTLVQTVATRDRTAATGSAVGEAELARALAPSASVPTDGLVRETANRIVAGIEAPAERARAIYEWMVENTWRDASVRGCGTGDVLAMLESGQLGGKCADLSSLFVALARASGLPAREVFGLRVADSRDFASIGRSGDVTKAQHCRAEVYLDGQGWLPVDPADVRKVVLEEKLPLADAAVQRLRERSFGNWEMNWIGFNTARDLRLPEGGPAQGFLMYPAALTAQGTLDCLDPANFRYAIASRPISA